MSVGVLTFQKFADASSPDYTKDFKGYINYIIRDEAVTTEDTEHIALFNDYIYKKSNKSNIRHDKLFTAHKDSLSKNEADELIKCFDKAQNNKSCMWQTVISFDNQWLASNGLYDCKTGSVDVYKLHEITRKHMGIMLDKENLSDTAVWAASIHFNTEHTHIHIATVEPNPTRSRTKDGAYKGGFKKSSILQAKSAVVNDIINQSEESILINDIIRKRIIESKKDNSILDEDNELLDKFLRLHDSLPDDKRLWKYNNNAMSDFRPLINEISKAYIDKYHSDDFKELEALLEKREKKYRDAYGKSDNFGSYKQKKIDDLYARLGNTILKEIKEYDNAKKAAYLREAAKNKISLKAYRKYNNARVNTASLNRLLHYLKDDYEHFRNQQQFEQLEWESEHQQNDYEF